MTDYETRQAINRGYRELAEAVIWKAVRDAKRGKADALEWVHSEIAGLWADEVGIPPPQWAGIITRIEQHIVDKKHKKHNKEKTK